MPNPAKAPNMLSTENIIMMAPHVECWAGFDFSIVEAYITTAPDARPIKLKDSISLDNQFAISAQ